MNSELQLVDPQPIETLPSSGNVFVEIEFDNGHVEVYGQSEFGVPMAIVMNVDGCAPDKWIGCRATAWSKTVTIVNMESNDE